MSGFSDIIGRDQIISRLKNTVREGTVSHAWLIEGGPGSGKMMLAKAFAAALLCEKKDGDACGECRSCHQAANGNHPDLVYVTHEKSSLISVGEIREQLTADIAVRPYFGGYKIYIVKDAELMNASAQNALLKTLEEPPSYAVIMLLTRNAGALLETVRSRCVNITLGSLDGDTVRSYLMSELNEPDYQAKLIAAFADGSIGRAKELSRSEEFTMIRDEAVRAAAGASKMDSRQIMAAVAQAAQFKDRIDDYLEILSVWFRDVLMFKAVRSPDDLIFSDHLSEITRSASRASYEGLEEIMQAVEKASVRLKANVSFNLTMELLLLTIKENT